MKLRWSSRTALLSAIAVIAVANAIALGGAAYNRSGEPESTLELTERELQILRWSWPDNENSSIDLHLSVRTRHLYSIDMQYEQWRGDWLTQQQLRELGFDTALAVDTDEALARRRRDPSKEVFLALEYDGPAYQEALEQRRRAVERAKDLVARNPDDERFEHQLASAREMLAYEEESESRLFAVDASLDAQVLRERYPDRARYAVVRGRVWTHVIGEPGQRRIAAAPPDVSIETIRVPYPYRVFAESMRSEQGDSYYRRGQPPRFAATVNFGRRLEPWIAKMESL